jgi:hypothetical protein
MPDGQQRREPRDLLLAGGVATETCTDPTELCCARPAGVAADRLAKRASEGGGVSDADAGMAAAMA